MWQQLTHPFVAKLKKWTDDQDVLTVQFVFFKVDDENKLWYMSKYGHVIDAARVDLFQ